MTFVVSLLHLLCAWRVLHCLCSQRVCYFKIFNKNLQYLSEKKFVNRGFEFWRGLGLLIETYNGILKYWPQILRVRYQVGGIGSGSILHVFGI